VARGRGALPWILAAAIGLATAAVFAGVVQNGFVNWDDDLNFTDNPDYRGLSSAHLRWMLSTLHGGHYQPLVWLTFGLDHAVWGMEPAGYHATSLAVHVVNAVLVFALLRLLLRARPGHTATTGTALAAAAGALAFALHPLRVESVAWLSERHGLLAATFSLLAVIAYLRAHEARRADERRSGWLAASVTCFALSLLCKASAMTLPLVLLVLDAYPLGGLSRGGPGWRRVLTEKFPYVVLAAVAMAVSAVVVEQAPASRSLAEHGPLQRLAQAAYGLTLYLGKSVLPLGLSPLYPLERNLDPSRARYVLSALAAVAITIVLTLLRRRWPAGLAGWTAYVLILLPLLGLVQRGPQIAADRYTYLASLPWIALLAAGLERLWGPEPRPTWRAATALGATAAVLGVLGALTIRQVAGWRDSLTLWEHAIRVDPANAMAYLNRGWARHLRGDRVAAIVDYGRAIRLDPHDALAFNNRGAARQELRDLNGALADLNAAIRLKPDFALAHYNRGILFQARGDLDAAIADYDEAIRLRLDDPGPYNNRGNARLAKGDVAGARADFDEAVRRGPDLALAHMNRARARERAGDIAGAIEDYRSVLAGMSPAGGGREAIARRLAQLEQQLSEAH
jgi:Tfp pilus assembly protein PilF